MEETDIFKALSDPARVRIIETIAKRGGCVSSLGEKLGKKQPNVSQHLRVLRMAGLVESKRNGREVRYCLSDRQVLTLIETARRMRR